MNNNLIYVNAFLVVDCHQWYLDCTFLWQKRRNSRISDRSTVTLFTSMHFGQLIVVCAISTITFFGIKDEAL